MRVIRDGLPVHFWSEKPTYRKPQRDEKDCAIKARMRKKLKAVRERRYIRAGFVRLLTSYLSLPKGEDDIRMVYNGTESGLNDSIWVPRFILPTVNTHLRAVDEETHMADEIIQGGQSDEDNVYQWVKVRLNLPGDENYDPNVPWVSKVRN
jgi:hypothetical protein